MNLNTCKAGDILISCHGTILKYVGKNGGFYPHTVEYPDGMQGTRLDNGQVYENCRFPEDEDIVFAHRSFARSKNKRGQHPTAIQHFGKFLISYLSKNKMELTEEKIRELYDFWTDGYQQGWHVAAD